MKNVQKKLSFRLAVAERQKYIGRVRAAVYDLEKDKVFLEGFEHEMEDFDNYLTKTLDVYLDYLRSFVTMIQGDSSLLISTYQKNLLEQEWDFIKNICPHIPGGEARLDYKKFLCEFAPGRGRRSARWPVGCLPPSETSSGWASTRSSRTCTSFLITTRTRTWQQG